MILNKLEVGESVFFPGLSAAHLRAGAAHKQRQHGHKIKFVVRTVEGGSRVWRVQ